MSQAHVFIRDLAVEVANRMKKLGLEGLMITFKAKKRAENAPEPVKFLGHGIADNASKSVALLEPTSDAIIIERNCIKLFESLQIPCEDVRGLGIHLTKLSKIGEQEIPQVKTSRVGISPTKSPLKTQSSNVSTLLVFVLNIYRLGLPPEKPRERIPDRAISIAS
jgi:hypothetical protein